MRISPVNGLCSRTSASWFGTPAGFFGHEVLPRVRYRRHSYSCWSNIVWEAGAENARNVVSTSIPVINKQRAIAQKLHYRSVHGKIQ